MRIFQRLWKHPRQLDASLLFTLLLTIQCTSRGRSLDDFPQVEHCSPEQGGGICPVSNTCCASYEKGEANISRCIPSDLGALVATCCRDGRSGCGIGYRCSEEDDGFGIACIATEKIKDPLVQILPRYYPLCQASKYSNFDRIYGLSSPQFWGPGLKMPYYSSHGDLLHLSDSARSSIHLAVVVVHGANRNADDYFCSITSAARSQNKYSEEQVLVVAPKFLVPSDHAPGESYLKWEDLPDGPWRYGANAIEPSLAQNISSFDVMDAMIMKLQSSLPNLQYVTICGHSSGGQFVQRWSLMTPYFPSTATATINENQMQQPSQTLRMRAVVANPSSYAYLTPLRYNEDQDVWVKPDVASCPEYNEWEWGLDPGDETPSYVHRVLKNFANASNPGSPYSALIERFAKRNVVYLQGFLDRCNVSSSSHLQETATGTTKNEQQPWCQSHGLETTCMDELQGTNRWERNTKYMKMLQYLGVAHSSNTTREDTHRRVVVPMVGHDHSLMFSSREGLQMIFFLDHGIADDLRPRSLS